MLNSQPQKTLYGLMDLLYPVGSYYITESSSLNTVDKMNSYFGGTWERLEDGRFLEAGSSISNKDAGLPNIIGSITRKRGDLGESSSESFGSGALSPVFNPTSYGLQNLSWGGTSRSSRIDFNASNSNAIYGKSTTVQPKSRVVYIYRRATLSGGGIILTNTFLSLLRRNVNVK